MELATNKKNIFYGGGILIIIIFLTVIVFSYRNAVSSFLHKNILSQKTNEIDLTPAEVIFKIKPGADKPWDLKGNLYLSLKEINGPLGTGIFTLNLAEADNLKLTSILADKRSTKEAYLENVAPALSADGKLMTFARGKAGTSELQIFVSDILGKNLKQITYAKDVYKRDLTFSPTNNLIAYKAYNGTKPPENKDDYNIPENWSSFITDLQGNVTRIADGVNPLFSPDGKKVLILQNDGLHLFDLSLPKNPQHWGSVVKTVGGRASMQMKISLSADKKMLAWSSENSKSVVVSKINSWDNFSFSPLLIIKTRAFYSVFSPDGKYLILNEWRNGIDGKEYPVLMVYDLASGKSRKIITLENFDKSHLWLGAWK
jgi:Tol biopolymer transport system component